ncbi:dGTPase [Grimontia hollisae]|uniref:Probable deoxyguanosinetriphosphate triphosphohydrolase n=1 Tax=Grimontia hollisae CIP 101886 TaxID=675812 RepID=D0I5Y4_GRIHO|nr:dGTPase [Grimontia hollisae]AMG29106.1 dGTPase [Grimontia hollisae]EEY73298.1 deoxyguanosinetriphosphate triphosphohydrolase [Grimontia hollisae CIP 101886]STO76881.1 Deoxyguanosinetriphosphate triphosphohydrolase [Grimontia hollisae]
MSHIDFRKKVSLARPHPYGSDLQRALESDRGRIINSAPIRRLQQKTQVFPLERNSAVRSRLTHSMEVQQVGRFIVHSIYDRLSPQDKEAFGLSELERAIESLVEIACLMHDMGNPPFGHCGEDAINRWFKKNLSQLEPMKQLASQLPESTINPIIHELCHFDGNAQAIRLVHSLHRFNLTYSQSAAVLKYTRPATEQHDDVPEDKSYLTKKVGYYITESRYVCALMETLDIQKYCRHPLSYIMEAADDISYCLADLEDAVEKRILSLETLTQHLKQTFIELEPDNRPIKGELCFGSLLDDVYRHALNDEISPTHKFFIKLRVEMVHPLVKHASKQFTDNLEAVYHGKLNRALIEDSSQFHALAKALKQVAINHVFNDPEVENLELQGYKIIGGLLDEYRPLLDMDKEAFQEIVGGKGRRYPVERRLFNKLSRKHVAAYEVALKEDAAIDNAGLWEFYLRCRLLQDYISGMTDQFAFDEYKTLTVSD